MNPVQPEAAPDAGHPPGPAGDELAELRRRLDESEETLRAIRNGEVDALVVSTHGEERVFTLEGAETPYRLFVDNIREGALTVAAHGTVLYSNRRFAELVDMPLERVVGAALCTFGEAPSEIQDFLAEAGQTGGAKRELNVRRQDGSLCPVYLTGSVLPRDENGRVCVIVTDLTQQRRTEELLAAREALRSANRRLETVLDSITDGYFALDDEWRFVELNPVAEQMFGRPEAALLGRVIWDEFPQGRTTVFFQQYERARRTQQPVHFEGYSRIVGRWFEAHVYPRAGRLEVYLRDIHDRKRIEEDLRESEERLSLALGIAGLGTWDWDVPSNTVVWSEQVFRLLGRRPRADRRISPQEWFDAIHPEDRERAMALLEEARATRSIYNPELRIIRADGRTAWLQLYARFFYDQSGAATRALGVMHDITQRRAIEEERNALLESERAARGEAERGSHLKDEFLAMLSHELRTPLSAVLGWVQMLRRGRLEAAEVGEALEIIERNAQNQKQLIEDLLDMSRIISGKMHLRVEPLDLEVLAGNVYESLLPAATSKGVQLARACQQPVWVHGDPARLQQVLWNLLSNAVKFTPAGGRVELRLASQGQRVVVTVSDTGMGIKPDFLPHLFERFRQADASTTRTHRGLGLGLSITRQLVELHGGSVRADSPGEGQGATFTIELPAAREPQIVSPRRGSERAEPEPSLHGLRVLVVEDDPGARDLLRRILQECGAQVLDADCAAAAFQLLQQEQPDVLVSDIGMPQEDGYSLIRRVRALPTDRLAATPALAVTAFVRPEDRTRAILAGYQAHLSKPVEPGELIALVASLAGRTGRGGGSS